MPIIRRKLDENTVYPTTIRYNPDTGTVQSNVNGDWVDNPAADPRTTNILPPRLTANPKCDAAQSVVDALKAQIDQIITAVGNASTAFTIAGLILGLLSFGVFAIFISIALTVADGMIGAGASALTAALTGAVYDQLKCILYCHMNPQGQVSEGQLAAIEADVTAQIGGLAATTINSMLSLAGFAGVSNLASLGTSTGDCSDCTDCDCLHPGDVLVGDFVEIGDDLTGHYIEVTAVASGWEGIPAFWAVVGGDDFCCTYQTFVVVSGTIASGGLFDCNGNPIGAGHPTGTVEFYGTSGTFTIKYYFS